MKIFLIFLSIAVIAYLLGSVNPSIVISKVFFKKDIRTLGSGNAGFTNMYRNFGAVPAIFALVLDPGKAVLSVFIGQVLSNYCGLDAIYGAYVAAVFTVLGHIYPVFFKFKGGKGVLAMAGAILLIHPYMLVFGLVIFVIVMLITKYVSLGSMLSCGTLYAQVVIWALIKQKFDGMFWFDLVFSIILSGIIVFTHRGNIKRIINKTERKITDKKKKVVPVAEVSVESVEKTIENKEDNIASGDKNESDENGGDEKSETDKQ